MGCGRANATHHETGRVGLVFAPVASLPHCDNATLAAGGRATVLGRAGGGIVAGTQSG